MKKKALILSLLLLTVVNVQAQNRFMIKAHIAPPLSNFKTGFLETFNGSIDYVELMGSAGVGLGIGIHYDKELPNNFHLVVGLDALRNPIAKVYRQSYTSSLDSDAIVKYSSYYNIPLSLGLRYEREVKENLALFVGAGINANLLKVSNHEISSGSFHFEEHYKPALNFGLSIEGGVVLNDRYQFSLGYKGLGKYVLQQTNIYTDNYTQTSLVIKNISLLHITFGIIL